MNEKQLMLLGTIGGIVAVLPILSWFVGGKDLQGNNRETLKTMVNFEILLFIVGVISNLIPGIGHIIMLVVGVINILISIKAFLSIDKEAFKLPIIEIIK